MDPRFGRGGGEFARSSEQIVLLLDRSRSMRAEDAQPSRFGLAASIAREVVNGSPGAAIGVVSFATDARIDSPLTRDARELHLRLQALKPEQNAQAGTSLERGLRLAADCFAKPLVGRKRLIVLSDGETHDEASLAGIEMPPEVDVFFLGIGDPKNGARIPLEPDERQGEQTEYFAYEGHSVWTRSRPEKLEELSQRLKGSYALVGSSSEALQILSAQGSGVPDSRQWEQRTTAMPIYGRICCGALMLLLAECLLLAGSLPKQRIAVSWATAVFLCLCAGGAAPPATGAQARREAAKLYNQGVDAYRRGKWQEAETRFRQARTAAEPEISRRSRFNLANANCELARRGGRSRREAESLLTEAIDLYRQCIADDQRPDDARANLQIAFSLLKQIKAREPTRGPSDPNRGGGSSSTAPAGGREGSSEGNQSDSEMSPVAPRDSGEQAGGPTAMPGPSSDWTDEEAEDELQRIGAAAKRRPPRDGKKGGQQVVASGGLPW
jgi:hypothetical protein